MRMVTKDVPSGERATVMRVQGRAISPAPVDPVVCQTNAITWLNVPYDEKELAKENGAKWDPVEKKWFAPPNVDLVCKR